MFLGYAAHPPGGWDHHIPQVVLEVPGEKELRAVTEKLTEAGVQVREGFQVLKRFPFWKISNTGVTLSCSTNCGWNSPKTSPLAWLPNRVLRR